jgi:hypothetical protein
VRGGQSCVEPARGKDRNVVGQSRELEEEKRYRMETK